MFHPDKYFLLDTFVCKGSLGVKYSSSYNDIANDNGDFEVVDSVDNTDFNSFEDQISHANYYDDDFATTFVSFSNSANALIRWMEYDEDLSLGMGYLHYKAGQTLFEAQETQLSILWQPIRPAKDNLLTNIMQVTYTVYLAETVEQAKAAVNCGVKS